MTRQSKNDAVYVVGDTAQERQRLTEQSKMIYPFTRQLFESAGIGPGMRVLDVGSGMGDVALLLAELVGPTGSITGIDRNADILEQARLRVPANVTLRHGDIRTVAIDGEFDAVVGRLVLMYQSDPVEFLDAAIRTLRPGGVVAFQEVDLTTGFGVGVPPSSDMTKLWDWLKETFRRAGVETQMGFKLRPTFLAAGLPEPTIQANSIIGGSPGWGGYKYAEDTFRSILPIMESHGVATSEEVEVDSVAARLEAEALDSNGTFMLSTWIGAWARRPLG